MRLGWSKTWARFAIDNIQVTSCENVKEYHPGSGKGIFGPSRLLSLNKYFDLSTPSMRKVDDEEKKKEKENNVVFSSHYVIAS